MRKYGRWMLALGILAVGPAVSNAQYVGQRAVAGSAARQGASYNQQMAEQIAGVLRKAQLKGYDVEIEFKNGVALLKGKVQDANNKARATKAVSSLRGITRVDNQLVVLKGVTQKAPMPMVRQQTAAPVTPAGMTAPVPAPAPAPAGPSNQQLANSIAGALSQAGLQGCDVEIRVQDGTAVLAGTVNTPQQLAAAKSVTSRIAGIKNVNSSLTLKPAAPPTMPVTFQQQVAARPAAPVAQPPVAPPMVPQPTAMPQPMMGRPMMPQAAMGPAAMAGGMNAGMNAGMYGSPNLPDYAWPSYAQYPNSAAISYPTQYSASAWPYIGPYYPYPQVPLGWRKAQLEWDDGHWQLSFDQKTDKWWWFMQPKNWGGGN